MSAVLDVVADRTRRLILGRLRSGPLSVGEIASGLGVTRPAVSQHLQVLKSAGLVSKRNAGNRRVYSIDRAGLREIRVWLEELERSPTAGVVVWTPAVETTSNTDLVPG